jgi:pyruvate/2-oxoglutarate dehydrogenase complex dihydrolipoamide dehydrogenase (E3) component
VWLSNGRVYECDLIISSIGVTPNVAYLQNPVRFLDPSGDGGVVVHADDLQVVPGVHAAGDCACVTSGSKHWMQRRLWSQARSQGRLAAMQMTDTADIHYYGGGGGGAGTSFELFAHHTNFFGKDIVLLGQFNRVDVEESGRHGEVVEEVVEEVVDKVVDKVVKSGDSCRENERSKKDDIEVLVRRSNNEFVKVVLENGRVIGATLLGQDMEDAETFENLIMNEIDVSGIDLLNPQVDLADYFD